MLQNINAPDLDKNEVEAEEMSEDDASICSSINKDETHPSEVEECDALELSQFEISPNQRNKRPCEDECDDAALLPSVKKSHTDCSDLLGYTGEDKDQSNELEGEDPGDDRESEDKGEKGGKKQKGGQRQEGEGGGVEEGEGDDESQRHIERQGEQGEEELGDEKEKQECTGDEIQKEKNKKEEHAQSGSCCKFDYDYIKVYIT